MPDGTVRADDSGRLAGRGAYVCRDMTCITNANARGNLGRALVTTVPAGLLDELSATVMNDIVGGGSRGQE